MTERLPISDVGHALTLADPREPEPAKLEALRILLSGSSARPVASARWRAMRASIAAELSRRSLLERRSPDAILQDEVSAAILLAAESARLVALRAFVESFSREIRARAADELLISLCGHHRADGPQFVPFDADTHAASDSEAVELSHLWERLPALARLTASEIQALEHELQGHVQTVAGRQALSRARRKIHARKII